MTTKPTALIREARRAVPTKPAPKPPPTNQKWQLYGETIHELRQRGFSWRDVKAWLKARGHLISVQGAVNAEAIWLRHSVEAK